MLNCEKCNRILEEKNFKKYSIKTNGRWYHENCRECEDRILYDENWNGELLKCHICGEFKETSSFQLEKSKYPYRNNFDKRCKSCKVNQNKKARINYSDDKKLNKVLLNRIHGVYQRTKDKNLDCNIDLDYLKELWDIQNGKCAISGIDMTYTLDEGRVFSNVSVDKINSKDGYIKGNVQLMCMSVNQLKSDFEMDVVIKICKNILLHNEIKL